MPAYLIVNYKVEDAAGYGEYSAAAGPVMKIGEACRILAFDPTTDALEGNPGHQTVMLEFESKEKAREVYDSGAYRELIAKRHAATSQHFAVLVNGIG